MDGVNATVTIPAATYDALLEVLAYARRYGANRRTGSDPDSVLVNPEFHAVIARYDELVAPKVEEAEE